jgi:hypothetical protein
MPLHHTVAALGHVGITDVICLMGFYTSVSMTLAFYDVPAGAEGMARKAEVFQASARTNPRRGPNAEIAALPQGSGRRDRDGRGRCISHDRKDRERQRSERQDRGLQRGPVHSILLSSAETNSIDAAPAKIIKTGPLLREVDHTRENFGRGRQSCAAAIPGGPAAAGDVRANVTRALVRG